MAERFTSSSKYQDGDIIMLNGVEYVIKTTEKEKKTHEERLSELEHRIDAIDKILKTQAILNLKIENRINKVNDSLWSTNPITGIPPFYNCPLG